MAYMEYSEERKKKILEEICDKLIEGQSLRRICMDSKDLPNAATIFRWMGDDDSEYATIIARARSVQADALFDDMSDLVNRMVEDGLDHNVTKTAIWAKQWQASKLRPKKYGDKLEVTNNDPKMSKEEMNERIRELLEKAKKTSNPDK